MEQAEVAGFRDPFAHKDWTRHRPGAVVMPGSVEEVQAVLRVANERKVPLWTSGQGLNSTI